MNFLKRNFYRYFDFIFLFVFSVLLFTYLLKYVATDIQAHLLFVERINAGITAYPANFLFYVLINVLSGFSSNALFTYPAVVLLLSLAVVFKYGISKKILKSFVKVNNVSSLGLKITLITLALFFCFAIPEPVSFVFLKKMYLGKIVPHVWHNSTSILLFPFAILLFWKQLELFSSEKPLTFKKMAVVVLLVLINIAIKPSFLFCYLPVTFLFLVWEFKGKNIKWLTVRLLPLFVGGALILLQYYLIYQLGQGSIQGGESGVALSAPFKTYSFFIPYWLIPFSFILSFALPIGAIVLYREILKFKPFLYALMLMIMGLLISGFIMETGPRAAHGNFTWQNIICCYLVFLSIVAFFTPKFLSDFSWKRKELIILGLFLVHVFSGVLYVFKLILLNSYT
ncbi:hypothetical protein POV27_19755 [Aureisphaera galaxeae]|uniref:hypothetical protein n=1 Tax=Aureisphaera galaxeae TaxID=1538023 RepID=UPI00234FC987|nr:hypothetical protein [Aureisphaera galaxeae]MDC8006299.1 hypothetical protein [Aureisphaera galaxeae]